MSAAPAGTGTSRAEPLDLLITGAGFAGLYVLHKARQQGLSALVIEAAPAVGGTWWHNRCSRRGRGYPEHGVLVQLRRGAAADMALDRAIYLAARTAAPRESCVADRFGLRDSIRLNTRLESAVFDESAGRWHAIAEDGRSWSARFLVMASGGLSAPNTPAFKGLDSFAGPVHHTANWPHETVDFSGLSVGVVGVVGAGSSGVQVIPPIAQPSARTARVPAHSGLRGART